MKKLRKKIVAMLLVSTLLMLSGSFAYAEEQPPVELVGGYSLDGTAVTAEMTAEEMAIMKEVEQKMADQEEALDAHALLWDSFLEEGETGWPSSFPEDYAGCYINDDNDLVIMLVNRTPASENAYKAICGNSDRVVFQSAQYSMNELLAYKIEAESYIEKYDLDSWSVDVKNNRVRIRVKEADYTNLKNELLKRRSTAPFGVEISNGTYTPTATNLYGGQTIKDSGIQEALYGTLCVGGTYNGYDAVVTAGHCVGAVNSTVYNTANVAIGTVVRKMYGHNVAGDYAVIRLNSNFVSTNKLWTTSNGIGNVASTYPYAPVGTLIRKYGSATKYSYGYIEDYGTDKYFSENSAFVIRDLVYALMTPVETDKAVYFGDSGGPVYTTYSGNYRIVGIVQGMVPDELINGKYQMYYTDIVYATGVGFSVKTI